MNVSDTITSLVSGRTRAYQAVDTDAIDELIAKRLIGIPFMDHGRTRFGIDCYGLVIYFFDFLGIKLPDEDYKTFEQEVRFTADMMTSCIAGKVKMIEPDSKDFLDILLFYGEGNALNHVGIYLKQNTFLHVDRHMGVVISKLEKGSIWKKRFHSVYRLCRFL